jgi:two-component system chemotaxis sensor kinase CheA
MTADLYKYFRLEARELLEQLGSGTLELEKTGDPAIVQRLLRVAHTLKGAARVVRLPEIAEHAHALEEALAPYRDGAGPVPADRIQQLYAIVDAIGTRVAQLDQPAAAPKATPTEPSWSGNAIRADLVEMDHLLHTVVETHSRVAALRATSVELTEARNLTELLAAQLSPRRQDAIDHASARALATQLADRIRRCERTFETSLAHVNRELGQVRDASEQLRLVAAGAVFSSLERTLRDSAHELGKSVVFEGRGGEVRIDAHVLAGVQAALVQLARNAVAHGIETARVRAARGKPEAGKVTVEVARRGRRVVFACQDDGGGLDVEAVRAAAKKRGVSMDGRDAGELVQILLRGGISTSQSVTEVAGRGVGLDVVREVAERLGGDVTVQTGPAGTRFELALPISLTSVEALVVESAGLTAAIPVASVRQTKHVRTSELSRSAGGESLLVDGSAVPFLRISTALRGADTRHRSTWMAIVVEHDKRLAVIGVERLAGISDIVIRPLPRLASVDPVIAGAAFDAGGTPLLVLDPEQLVAAAVEQRARPDAPERARISVLVIDDSLTTRLLEQSILESAGYDVDTATSAEQGLETARQKQYALFLVDVEMPGMDGFAFVEHVRADPRLRDTPAILVTSRSSPEDRRRGETVGAQGYIVKSEFDQVDLLARIERMVR